MITIEIRGIEDCNSDKAEVEMFCDAEGLSALLKQLGHLTAGSSHVHLMTPAWAGNELAESPVGDGTKLVNHLRITLVHGNIA